eukprot:TRINITY_DN37794_c0_g1_i1.p1 TRINITY_DN37794_c0_g1~~TRINITY_DN37794_c0_g1_i1.p1  ORF type:complete len:229 (+),score=69.79 TRINITY_DN37794_c0_g1_i1:75-689(+)
MSEEVRGRVEDIMKEYVGTNWFHNYTKEKAPGDPSTQRYITEFKIESIDVIDGLEMATISVKGAAFMIHQIRRMVAMAIVTYNARLGPSYIVRSMEKDEKVGIPTAPPTGLLLKQLVFGFYQKKVEALRRSKQPGWKELEDLTFEKSQGKMDAMHMRIKAEIMSQEAAGRVMACWVRSLPHIVSRYTGINMYEKLAKGQETGSA